MLPGVCGNLPLFNALVCAWIALGIFRDVWQAACDNEAYQKQNGLEIACAAFDSLKMLENACVIEECLYRGNPSIDIVRGAK